GNCLSDSDGDGVCDELEVAGCTDSTACNYDAAATEDDDSCEYPEAYYNCAGDCLSDSDADGVCDELEVEGCQDETACNYDALATDAGDCEYAAEFYDCDGNCLNDGDGDGVCDELEVDGCTDDTACNFNPDATEDDATCTFPGDACDDGDDTTINDMYTADCDCVGEVDGLDEATALFWTLYPSPVRDVLNLRLEGGAWSGAIDGDVEVVVLGATGQVLRSERLAGRTQLDVSDLASGVYFLTLRSPAMATTTRRFVVAGGE
ncbi:MAG: T9SS type A sorting domain-containing protein, partial [Bacteroidota bacterium]|nr:T9SS type A sorting domain-containing protein [Bacteroidota bacterium]